LKIKKNIMPVIGYTMLSLVCLHLFRLEAIAAEAEGSWRPVFDEIMRWLNFGILAFVLIKFSRGPIKNFFGARREEMVREIETLENEKQAALQEIDENLKQLEDSGARFEAIKERIVAQGEKNKQKIIEDAKQESKALLEGTRQKIDSQIIEARNKLRKELIDSAIAIAIERLPAEMTAQDNQKWVDIFITNAGTE
jgi:F-type H+-transporting ATPase subunit b